MGREHLGGSSHLVSRLFKPSYKWINPTYPTYNNWGYNLPMIHQTEQTFGGSRDTWVMLTAIFFLELSADFNVGVIQVAQEGLGNHRSN